MLMKIYAIVAATAISSLFSACATENKRSRSENADLCDVAESPSSFQGKTATFDVIAIPTSHYVTAVFSPRCEDSKFALAISSKAE